MYFLIAGCLLALTYGAVLAQPTIAAWLHHWRLLPEQERFTELYFKDHEHLPTHMQDGKTYTTAVTLRSAENTSVSYRYALALKASGSPSYQAGEGTIVLQPGQAQTIRQTFTAPVLNSRTKVVFSIRYTSRSPKRSKQQTQTIHFWTQPVIGQSEVSYADR